MKKLNQLPQAVQMKVKNILRAFNKVNVIFGNGEYYYTVGTALKAKYATEHKFIGTFYAKDIFTEAERIVNYINEFNKYPANYKGLRDYAELEKATARYNPKTNSIESGLWAMDNNGNLRLVGMK